MTRGEPGPAPGAILNRAAWLRRREADLRELAALPAARWLVLAGPRAAILSSRDRTRTSLRWFARDELIQLGADPDNLLFLGLDPATAGARFAVAIGEREAEAAKERLSPLVDLRSLATQGLIPYAEFELLAAARSLSEWHAAARYCGRCGSPNLILDGGWKVACSVCSSESFPRVDPVVIMLVTDGDRCVLAHEPRFPERMVSCLAGFVEPGEDIEAAVRRETGEEIGVELRDVSFVTAQPWPFPHTLMLGCRATAASTDLVLDTTEIADARWYPRDEVAAMLDGRHPGGLFLPSGHAIAHRLIRGWVDDPGT